MTFQQFKLKVDQFHQRHFRFQCDKPLKYDHSLMIVLDSVWPEKYNEIMGTDYDCFYTQGRAKETLKKLEKEWNDR